MVANPGERTNLRVISGYNTTLACNQHVSAFALHETASNKALPKLEPRLPLNIFSHFSSAFVELKRFEHVQNVLCKPTAGKLIGWTPDLIFLNAIISRAFASHPADE